MDYEEFHTSFLNIIKGLDPLEKEYNLKTSMVQKKEIATVNNIIQTAPHFLQGVKRPQRLISTHKDYYIARDTKTNTVYMCFKNILMLDFDNEQLDIETLINALPQNMSFKIYKTKRGFHAFCISKKFEYRTKETVEFMYQFKHLGVDIDYIRFCYIRGFSVRLNKKFNGENEVNYIYLTTTNEHLINDELNVLVDLHFQECTKYEKDLNIN